MRCITERRPMTLSALMLGASMVSNSAAGATAGEVFERVKESVVVVVTIDEAGRHYKQGSGVVVAPSTVITNCHVVEDAKRILVGALRAEAKRLNGSYEHDLCLLKAVLERSKPAAIGSTTALGVGSPVYAVGAPQGLELTMSDGIVSQRRGRSPALIQTTAAISPGSSGGGLFDASGVLVGITTFNFSEGQNLNFALPVERVSELLRNKGTKGAQEELSFRDRFVAAARSKDYELAARLAKDWTAASPDKVEPLYRLGLALLGLREASKAREALNAALRIAPQNPDLWSAVGHAYALENRYDIAKGAYKKAATLDPNVASYWHSLGRAHVLLSETAAGVESLTQAVQLNPDLAEAWDALGQAYGLLGLAPEGRRRSREDDLELRAQEVDAYKRAYELAPGNVEYLLHLGRALAGMGRCEEALDLATALEKLDPSKALEYQGSLSRRYGPCSQQSAGSPSPAN